jgi:hypothetical protein
LPFDVASCRPATRCPALAAALASRLAALSRSADSARAGRSSFSDSFGRSIVIQIADSAHWTPSLLRSFSSLPSGFCATSSRRPY